MANIGGGPRVFLARVLERLSERGHELLDTEWRGWNAPYRLVQLLDAQRCHRRLA